MATVDGKGHASGLPPLGISRSDRKRTAELLFGAKVSKSMGLFHAKIEAENFAEEKEPTVKMSKSRKVEVVGRAIRSITTQCASMGCPNAVEMFDWSEFEYVHTKESILAALTTIATWPFISDLKIGITTCPLWRMVTCNKKGPNSSMKPHFPVYNYVFIVSLDYGNVSAFWEKSAIAALRKADDVRIRDELANIKSGGDGTVRAYLPTYLYVACKRPGFSCGEAEC